MKQSGKIVARVFAFLLVFTAVFSVMGESRVQALESEPVLYIYSGGDETYRVGDVIKLVYKYSPCYKYEYTYCRLYNSENKKLAQASHSWENTSTGFVFWAVNIDTSKLELTPGVYYLKSFVKYKKNNKVITASVKWTTIYLKKGATVELNREKYTYTVSYLKTKVPKKTITLKATVEGTEKAVTWSSSDETVATVNAKGKVTMKALGTCTITAKVAGASASCKITVKKQTGTAYYKKYIKPLYEDVLECVNESYENLEDMRERCDEALEEARELKNEIYKVKNLKKDSLVRKYMSVLMTNIRKADERVWMDGIDVDDAQMIQFRENALKYVKLLNSRIKTLLKK